MPLAQARSDFVVLGGRLMAIAGARAQAVRTMTVVRQNLAWAAIYNLLALPLAAAGLVTPWLAALGMAASSLLVTLNALRLAAGGGIDSSPGATAPVAVEAHP